MIKGLKSKQNGIPAIAPVNEKSPAYADGEYKRIIKYLMETRQAFTPKELNEAGFIDLNACRVVFEVLTKNSRVQYDGMRFSYKPKHDLKDKIQLLQFIQKFPEGIAINELMDAYPSVVDDLQALEDAGQIWLLRHLKTGDRRAFPSDPRLLPSNMIDHKEKNKGKPSYIPAIIKVPCKQKMQKMFLNKFAIDQLSELIKNSTL